MHILIIPSWYKEYKGHTLGSFFEEQARSLLKRGNKVGLIFPVFFPISDFFKTKRKQPGYFNDRGLNTFIFNIQSVVPRWRNLNNLYMYWRTERIFKEYVRRFGKPDIIHAHSVFHAGYIGEKFSKKFNIPMVITEHLTHYMTGNLTQDFDIPMAIKTFNNSDYNIVVGNLFRDELAKALNLSKESFHVVYNMVADIFFENFKRKEFNKEKEDFIFFTNSFLNPRKNHKLIFDAMKTLIDKGYKIKMVVGGFGIMEKELKSYVKEMGIDSYVEFTGELSRKGVKDQLDKCHAFALSSNYETFGVVLIESLACGRPVISTNSGGPKDIVKNNNGIMVDSFDKNDFAKAMEEIINHYSEYDQEQIRKECYQLFSEEIISGKLMDIYEKVIREGDKSNHNHSTILPLVSP